MFKSRIFTLQEWILSFILGLIPLINIGFVVFLLLRIGFLQALKKIVILIVLYVILVFLLLALLNI